MYQGNKHGCKFGCFWPGPSANSGQQNGWLPNHDDLSVTRVGIYCVSQFHASCIEARAANSEAFPPTADRLAVGPEEAGTPLDDLTSSGVPPAALQSIQGGDSEAGPLER